MRIGPKYKICKRLGSSVFEKCQTQRYLLSEARRSKNQKRGRPRTLSDYGRQLLEKQKVRFTYGISEKQLVRAVRAVTQKKGIDPALRLYITLESRLDNVVYRLGLATTRRFARQMVSHGHITVNERKVTIPSFTVSKKEKIGIREGSRKKTLFSILEKQREGHVTPPWITYDEKVQIGEVVAVPSLEGEIFLDFSGVLEYYSR